VTPVRASICALGLLCLLQTSCGDRYLFPRSTARPAGPCGVEFVGLFEERCELVRGLRRMRTLDDLQRLLDESRRPGGTDVCTSFTVSTVLSGGCLEPGDHISIVFPSRKSAGDPVRLPAGLVGKKLRIVMHDPFTPWYHGRFSYSEWHQAGAAAPREARASVEDATSKVLRRTK
jgi:hypothetical protein